ncbi:unnamed protein product [Symbiodinium sp. CCMP2592]|nr:unnamed protein product [Symbiodinium sp. CCMP2592]
MSSAMKRPADDGEELPAKKPRTLPAIGQTVEEDHHVFISLEGYAEKVSELFELGNSVVFIRSGVATGKTTLAEHLARQFPSKFVLVPFTGAGKQSVWTIRTIETIEKATDSKIDRDDLAVAFANSLTLAKEKELTLVYDEAHTLFASSDLCSALFKSDPRHRPKLLLFSAAGDASRSGNITESTPAEITQKFMWTPPLSYTKELQTELKEAGVRLDQKSIEFFIHFCGGHRGIFIAAMHWVSTEQRGKKEEIWSFAETVRLVRKSYAHGDWNTADRILSHVKKSRAIHVNGRYQSLDAIPEEFIRLLCGGSCMIEDATKRRDLCIHGFILPKHEEDHELQNVNWSDYSTKYKVSNPLMASYYRQVLKQERALQVAFTEDKPQHCADLLLRALPYLLFSKVVSFAGDASELATDGFPIEAQYTQAIRSVLEEVGYQPFAPELSDKGKGKPDLVVHVDEETFVMEGAKSRIQDHLHRFETLEMYKKAKHKGLCIISNDGEKMLKTVRETKGSDVQLIVLVPNIAHTAYTVHVKSKGIEPINTFSVDCDLVARRLVLKDDGKPELYSVQSLKSVNLSPEAQSSPSAGSGGTTSSSVVWVRELARKDKQLTDGEEFEPTGNAFKVRGDLTDVDDLKKAIKTEKPNRVKCDADELDIYSQQDGNWVKEDEANELNRGTSKEDCYWFVLPQKTDDV